jgi:feruloyl esterase
MVEAQRFPDDFDGIIAGAPPLDETGDAALHLVWSARASVDAEGRQIIDPDKVPMIHRAALAACGGTEAGYIAEPLKCNWDPGAIACKAAPASDCLTALEVGAVRKIYQGARDASGRQLFAGGMMRGSELEWVPLFIGKAKTLMPGMAAGSTLASARAPVFVRESDNQPLWLSDAVAGTIRNVMLERDPGTSFSLLKVDLVALRDQMRLVEPIYNAQNPDLRAFKAHGGKLLLYHGLNDAEIPPGLSIDYYETAVRTMGGQAATSEFFRFFLLPGMAHCRRGPGPDAIDLLTVMEDWVERGKAPDELVAYQPVKPQSYMGLPVLRYPLAPEAIRATHRVKAYHVSGR